MALLALLLVLLPSAFGQLVFNVGGSGTTKQVFVKGYYAGGTGGGAEGTDAYRWCGRGRSYGGGAALWGAAPSVGVPLHLALAPALAPCAAATPSQTLRARACQAARGRCTG